MKVISVDDVKALILKHGFAQIMQSMVQYIKEDFCRWKEFSKSPRHATHVEGGVIELMPVADDKLYSFKYVNGHPANPLNNKQTVVATGQLSRVSDGYPIMLSEMTLLTALRTAATSLIASDILARTNSRTLAIIGTGAQSEFQTLAHLLIRDITQIKYYDSDENAMLKYANNLSKQQAANRCQLIACTNAQEAVQGADIVIVCTACKDHVDVILDDWVTSGMHINGLGGDCPGKTELELGILFRSKVVVEYTPQSLIEGEIQRLKDHEVNQVVYGELWQLINQSKVGRSNDHEITVFDSVGFALEDFSALRLIHDLTSKSFIGNEITLTPELSNCKDLFGLIC